MRLESIWNKKQIDKKPRKTPRRSPRPLRTLPEINKTTKADREIQTNSCTQNKVKKKSIRTKARKHPHPQNSYMTHTHTYGYIFYKIGKERNKGEEGERNTGVDTSLSPPTAAASSSCLLSAARGGGGRTIEVEDEEAAEEGGRG